MRSLCNGYPNPSQVFDEAKEAYKEAMRIFVLHHGPEHSDVAKVRVMGE